jgi:hypothetical protein
MDLAAADGAALYVETGGADIVDAFAGSSRWVADLHGKLRGS